MKGDVEESEGNGVSVKVASVLVATVVSVMLTSTDMDVSGVLVGNIIDEMTDVGNMIVSDKLDVLKNGVDEVTSNDVLEGVAVAVNVKGDVSIEVNSVSIVVTNTSEVVTGCKVLGKIDSLLLLNMESVNGGWNVELTSNMLLLGSGVIVGSDIVIDSIVESVSIEEVPGENVGEIVAVKDENMAVDETEL